MNYSPNVEAARWLANDVWPTVRSRIPTARLSLVGSDPSPSVRRADPTIDVTGTVPDVRPYLWRSAVAVAPLAVARGIQNKVMEALAAGVPCVVTPAVFEGLPREVAAGCAVASGSEHFATAIIRLLEHSAVERGRIADQCDLSALGWNERLSPLEGILERAVRRP